MDTWVNRDELDALRSVIDDVHTALETSPVPPEAIIAALLLLVVLGIILTIRYIRLYRQPGRTLRRVFAGNDEAAILVHQNPDPDAMATAMGLATIADDAGAEPTLYYPGEIRHQENRAFRTVLDLDITRIEAAADVEGDVVALADHNQPRGLTNADNIHPDAVVDHHPGDGTGSDFTDVRPEYGACATIVAEYFQQLGMDPSPPDEDDDPPRPIPVDVATGLLYGILSDTNHLTNGATSAEFQAAEFLYPGIDEDWLDRIANPEVDAEVLEVTARAISDRDVRPPYCVADVGTVSNVDAIPQAADDIINLEGVSAVVVMGDKDETLHLSGRSRDDRVHMGTILERTVEDIPMSGAGGHARMGGGQVSIEHMDGIGPSGGLSRSEFVDQLFRSMEGQES